MALEPEIQTSSSRSLWIGVTVLFTLMALAWTAMFIFSSRNPVETVPLEHQAP